MSADALMLFIALAFSFVLLDGDVFGQGQRFYGYFTLATALSIVFFALAYTGSYCCIWGCRPAF